MKKIKEVNEIVYDKRKLKESLSMKGKDENLYVLFNLKRYYHQKEILEDLNIEKEEYGSCKNLVIPATGERVIIVMGAINALKSRTSGTFIKNNLCIA